MDNNLRDAREKYGDGSHEAHLPRYVLKLIEDGRPEALIAKPRQVDGAYAFLDISGFTPLSEVLSRHGREGTEILTHTISSYFHKALESVFVFGGDVVKFGGDALTILFERKPGEDKTAPLLRACSSALSVMASVSNCEARTPFGSFSLKLKIGIASGTVQFMVLGDPATRLEYVFSGDPIDKTAEAEHHASPSEIIIDPASSSMLKRIAGLVPREVGFSLLTGLPGQEPHMKREILPAVNPGLIRPYIFPAVFEHVLMGNEDMLSEHRPVVSCFVSFPSIDLGSGNNNMLLQDYFLKVTELLRGLGGSFNRMDMGDKGSKFLCFFGAPESYADNEERAVAFALELKELEKKLKWLKGQSIGITSGTCYAGVVGSEQRREYTIMGDTVNVSARLMAAARGRILVSKDVREKTRKKFRYGPSQKLKLKGKEGETSASTPLGLSRGEDTGSVSAGSLFVGRTQELKKLLSMIERSGKPVYMNGAPGIGKSSLAKKAAETLSQRGWTVNFLSVPISSPHPFYSAEKVLRAVSGSSGNMQGALDLLREKHPGQAELLPLFAILTNEKVEAVPAVASLSQEQRIETLADLFSKLISVSPQKRLVLIEDLDRMGKEETDFFSKVFERMDSSRVRFLMTERKRETVGGMVRSISLAGFLKEDIENYLVLSFRAKAVPDPLVSFLLERSTGNPLYLKEIISGLREMKALCCNSDGFVVWNPDSASKASGSIEEILLMRLDNLDYSHKNLVKVASCLGESFDTGTLSEIYVPRMEQSEICRLLDDMQDLGIEREEGSKYRFSNKLLGNVAYDSILVSNKKALHAQIARMIERTDNSDANWEVLAYHYSRADDPSNALQYALKAARKAFGISAFHEARRLYCDCLKFAETTGAAMEERDLLDYSKSLITTSNYEEATRLLTFLTESGNNETALTARFQELTILDQKGEYFRSAEAAKSLFELANKVGNGEIAVSAFRYSISSLLRLGDYKSATNRMDEGYRTALKYELEKELPHLYILSGSILCGLGDFSKANNFYLLALDKAAQDSDFELQVRSYFGISNCLLAMNELEQASVMAGKAYDISHMIGSRLNMLGAIATIAMYKLNSGQPEHAFRILSDSFYLVDIKKNPYSAAIYFNQFGVSCQALGQLPQALRQYSRTYRIARKAGITQYLVIATYNISDIQRELGEKEKAKSGLMRIIRNYASSIDRTFLLKIASDLLDLVEEDLERQRLFRFLRKTAVSLQSPLLFDDLIDRHGV